MVDDKVDDKADVNEEYDCDASFYDIYIPENWKQSKLVQILPFLPSYKKWHFGRFQKMIEATRGYPYTWPYTKERLLNTVSVPRSNFSCTLNFVSFYAENGFSDGLICM